MLAGANCFRMQIEPYLVGLTDFVAVSGELNAPRNGRCRDELKKTLLKCNTQFMFIRSLFRTLSLGSNFFNSGSESRIVCNIDKHALSSSNSNIQLAKLHFKLLPTWTASGRQMNINWGGNVPSALLWEINSNALLFPDLVWCQNKNYGLRTLNIGFKVLLASTKRWYVVKLPWSMTSITDRSRLYASLACTFANRYIANTHTLIALQIKQNSTETPLPPRRKSSSSFFTKSKVNVM